MKITPKFQRGGQFSSYFTVYTPLEVPQPSQKTVARPTTSSNNGKLTEKDLFDMIKDIDGLPNDMQSIVGNLLTTFQWNNLTGTSTSDLATTYLQNIYQIKLAKQNKEYYDEALKNAYTNGSLSEPAITSSGDLVVQKSDGSISSVSLETYMNNQDKLHPLTVSNLADMRKFDPQLVGNSTIFSVINTSIGFQNFQNLIEDAVKTLGTTEYSREGMFSVEGKASQGLALLQTLREDDRVQALGSITAAGLYKYKIIDKNQLSQINALKKYIITLLPERAKTWAALKTGQTNKDQAAGDLVLTYLLGRQNVTHDFDISYSGGMDKAQGSKSSSSGGSQEDPKEGFWRQVQSGKGGDDFTYTILTKTGRMSVSGKFYGTTPGMDINKSLGDYINDSQVGYLIKNNKNITFGDTKISVNSFNDVMINANSGAAVVSLPIKIDGTVDLSVADRWIAIQDKLKASELSEESPEYNQRLKQLVHENQLDGLLDANGLPNKNRFGHFLVLEGFTSDKAKAVKNNKQVSFGDIESDFILPAGDDSEIYDMIEKGLSNKDRGEYEFNRNWDWSLGHNELYKGNIYIPLNTNPINAYNADDNDIKQSTSYLYEKAQQGKSTSSEVL